jgi:hypothetical protein
VPFPKALLVFPGAAADTYVGRLTLMSDGWEKIKRTATLRNWGRVRVSKQNFMASLTSSSGGSSSSPSCNCSGKLLVCSVAWTISSSRLDQRR